MAVSVWSFPRPPAVEPEARRARVELGGEVIADSTRALRVLETSHPPTIYLPPEDVRMELLEPVPRATLCEFKGRARYFDLVVGARRAREAAWSFPAPVAGYERLAGHVGFYPSAVDACFLGDERVVAQPGDFYGGWITGELEGPFKGGPGTLGW